MTDNALSTQVGNLSPEQVDLIKRTICKGADDNELELFLQVCNRTGLDPFTKQIHAVKRWSSAENRMTMAIQTGIDGFRLIAERTGKYAGNDDPIYDDESGPHPGKATVTVHKLLDNGQTASFTATARWDEYKQTKKNGDLNPMWVKLPYLMLGKCAEALALRKAFPADLAGLYTHEEMGQADSGQPADPWEGAPWNADAPALSTHATPTQISNIKKMFASLKVPLSEGIERCTELYGVKTLNELSDAQAKNLMRKLIEKTPTSPSEANPPDGGGGPLPSEQVAPEPPLAAPDEEDYNEVAIREYEEKMSEFEERS